MYVTVVPAVRSIRGKDEFVYSVPDDVSVSFGQVIEIPWRSQIVPGIVWKCSVKKPTFQTKTIHTATEIILPQSYLNWITWLSTFYYVSKSHVAKMVLPDIPHRSRSVVVDEKHESPKVVVSKDRIQTIRAAITLLTNTTEHIQTLLYARLAESVAVIRGLLSTTDQTVAIVVAEEYQIALWAAALQKWSPVIVHSRLSKNAMYSAWVSACTTPSRIYIGTKRLSLFPLHQFDKIIVIDPENQSHKQWDLNPRYSVPRVIEAQLHDQHLKTDLVFFSQSPTVEYTASDQPIQTQLISGLSDPAVTLIDMTSERFEYDQTLLSRSVIERCGINRTLFLWLNKKGSGSFLVCKTCDELLSDISVLHCPKCHGIDLVKRGLGTTSLTALLRKQFPNRTIIELTKDTGAAVISYDDKPIIIGTTYAETLIDWQRVDSVVVVSIDNVLSQPEFRSAETTLHNLVHLRNVTKNLIIQTYAPNHAVFRALSSYYPAWWYHEEVQRRKEFSLPPFGSRIWLRNTETGEEKIIQTTKDIPTETTWIVDREL